MVDRTTWLGAPKLLGGRENASPEEPGVQAALQFAMNEYNRGSNDMYASRVSEVVEAQKQIVAGVKYFFTVRIGRTVCRKGASDLENCAFHDTPKLAQVSVHSLGMDNITRSTVTKPLLKQELHNSPKY
uniref:Cystatin n=1 Tax=Pseudonaja textilis TaxID=8673 RepID=A0A670Y9D9_PSETE